MVWGFKLQRILSKSAYGDCGQQKVLPDSRWLLSVIKFIIFGRTGTTTGRSRTPRQNTSKHFSKVKIWKSCDDLKTLQIYRQLEICGRD